MPGTYVWCLPERGDKMKHAACYLLACLATECCRLTAATAFHSDSSPLCYWCGWRDGEHPHSVGAGCCQHRDPSPGR